MQLINKISKEHFWLEYLKSEWYSNRYDGIRNHVDIDKLSPFDYFGTERIYLLLWTFRHTVLCRLPEDIEWQVCTLSDQEFENLTIIRETTWGDTLKEKSTYYGQLRRLKDISKVLVSNPHEFNANATNSHVRKIFEIFNKMEQVSTKKSDYDFSQHKLILIQKKGSKVYSILEGNHRAVAASMFTKKAREKLLSKEVIVGVSKNMDNCIWYNRRPPIHKGFRLG